uniref:Uncharacterized protein n=1 Tax=Anguilla anguilla TaxID=7936 RepID=A0A0E9QHU8_ANGAN
MEMNFVCCQQLLFIECFILGFLNVVCPRASFFLEGQTFRDSSDGL